MHMTEGKEHWIHEDCHPSRETLEDQAGPTGTERNLLCQWTLNSKINTVIRFYQNSVTLRTHEFQEILYKVEKRTMII